MIKIPRIKYRPVAIIALLISAVSLFFVTAENLCFDYFSSGHIMKISEIYSSGNDDDIVFTLLALVGLLFVVIFSFCKNKIIYVIFAMTYLLVSTLISWWTESNSFTNLLYTSIYHCQNNYLLIFVLGQVLFWLLSICFIKNSNDVYE
ncbi:hypothetical protein [Moraxella lacunata]|nr:hypothetical protein [Moraxella lacunata]